MARFVASGSRGGVGGTTAINSIGGGGRARDGAGGSPCSSAESQDMESTDIILISLVIHPMLQSGLLDYLKLICRVLKLADYYDIHFLDLSTNNAQEICDLFKQSSDYNAVWLTNMLNRKKFQFDCLLERFILQVKYDLFNQPKLVFVLQPENAYQNVLISSLVYKNRLSQEASSCLFMSCCENEVSGHLKKFIVENYVFVLEKNDMDIFNISQSCDDQEVIDVLYDFITISTIQFHAQFRTFNSNSRLCILNKIAELLLKRLQHRRCMRLSSEAGFVELLEKLSLEATIF